MLPSPHSVNSQVETQFQLSQQQTIPLPGVSNPTNPGITELPDPMPPPPKQNRARIIAILFILVLAVVCFFIWHSASPTSSSATTSQQNFGNASTSKTFKNNSPNTSSTDNGNIQVYVVGAVKHPGVYTLPPDARVYQLLQAAGGPLPNANLVALNLAAKLSDGQEVYVTVVGETPPTYVGGVPGPGTPGTTNGHSGQLININTASADEMRQSLHISSTTAQNIVNYRLQHGNFTSVDQLLQLVSRSIYDRIKDLVTV